MNDDCLPIEQLETVLRLDAEDPRRQHLESCPRCRSLLATYQQFMEGSARPVDAADAARLEAALNAEILADSQQTAENADSISTARHQARGERDGGAHGPLARLRDLLDRLAGAPLLRPAVSVAALLVVGLVIVRSWDSDSGRDIVLRGGDLDSAPAELHLLPPSATQAGGVQLSWSSAAGADAYRVQLFDTQLLEIARFDTGADTTLVVAAERLAELQQGSPTLVWQVQALKGGDEIDRSEPGSILPSSH